MDLSPHGLAGRRASTETLNIPLVANSDCVPHDRFSFSYWRFCLSIRNSSQFSLLTLNEPFLPRIKLHRLLWGLGRGGGGWRGFGALGMKGEKVEGKEDGRGNW